MINELLRWRKEATKEDWAKLAELSVTTTGYLDQIAYGYRRASPTKAENIQEATIEIKKYRPVTKESLVSLHNEFRQLSNTIQSSTEKCNPTE